MTTTSLIVLSKSNFSESSIVVQCFSRLYGKVGLLVTGVKKRKSKVKSALFEPLSILEVHANFDKKNGLIIPKDVKTVVPLLNIHSSMVKRSVAFFLSEMLHKSLFEALPDEEAFDFLHSGIEFLNYTQKKVSNFHIMFLLKFTRYLGFQPMITAGDYLDLYDGVFSTQISSSSIYFTENHKVALHDFFGLKFDKMDEIILTVDDRKFFLDFILQYYRAHIPGMTSIKSHHILEEILH